MGYASVFQDVGVMGRGAGRRVWQRSWLRDKGGRFRVWGVSLRM